MTLLIDGPDMYSEMSVPKSSNLIESEFETLWDASKTERTDEYYKPDLQKPTVLSSDFVSKPEKIQFLDFELDKNYSKTVSLVNVTSQMTTIRFKEQF